MQEAQDRVVQAQGDKQHELCKTTVTGELSLEWCHQIAMSPTLVGFFGPGPERGKN